MRWLVVALTGLGALACGDDPVVHTPPGEGGGGGMGGSGDGGCPTGERTLDDGTCLEPGALAGIDACPEGFAADADRGCVPVLPTEACADGMMALVGETRCRAVAPCGAGPWGDIPLGDVDVFVDDDYLNSDADGSAAKPWPTVAQALAAAASGDVVAIAAGQYAEALLIDQPLTLWGKCPGEVAITGDGNTDDTIIVDAAATVRGIAVGGHRFGLWLAADGASVRDAWIHDVPDGSLTITGVATADNVLVERGGALAAVFVSSSDATIAGLVIRDVAGPGLRVEYDVARASLLADAVIVDRATDVGIMVRGADATLSRIVVVDTRTVTPNWGYGLFAFVPSTVLERASVSLDGGYFAGNRELAVNVAGSSATLDRVVIRDTHTQQVAGSGRGLQVRFSGTWGELADVHVQRSLIADNHDAGVAVTGGTVELDRVVIRGTKPLSIPGLQTYGHGVTAFALPDATTARASIVDCSLEANSEAAVSSIGGDISIEGTLIRGTFSHPTSGLFGRGINAQYAASAGKAASLSVEDSAIEGNREVAVALLDAVEAELDNVAVRDTQSTMVGWGWGIGVQTNDATLPPQVALRDVLLQRNVEIGLAVSGGSVVATQLVSAETRAGPLGFGDGIALGVGASDNSLDLDDVWVRDNERAGLAVFSGIARVNRSRFSCNGFSFNTHSIDGSVPEIDIVDEVTCDCDGAPVQCRIASEQLTPPTPP